MYRAWPDFHVITVCSLKFIIIIIITLKLQNFTFYRVKAYCKTIRQQETIQTILTLRTARIAAGIV
jgi:hypothetical protein